MIVAGRHVIVGGQDEVGAFDAKGKLVWTQPVTGRAYGLAVANGSLVVSTDLGHTYAFRPGGRQVTVAKAEDKQPRGPLTPIKPVSTPGLVGRWVFQSPHVTRTHVKDLAGNLPGQLSGSLRFQRFGTYEALRFGSIRTVMAENHNKAKLPTETISAAAWVKIDRAKTWGSIIGAIQDNGSYEHGWLLGNRGQKFCFAVAAKGSKPTRLTYMTAPKSFSTGKWYHVAGTYDGKKMTLYVNGKAVVSSNSQKGKISYPPQAFYEIGAYHDKDENFPLDGEIHEVQLYNRALKAGEVVGLAKSKKFAVADPYQVATGPYLRFTSPTTAEVRWQTKSAGATELQLQVDGRQVRTVKSAKPTSEHQVTLKGLVPGRYYTYTIHGTANGKRVSSQPFECDMFFNFQPSALMLNASKRVKITTQQLLNEIGVRHEKRGLSLLVGGTANLKLAESIVQGSQIRVVIVERDVAVVNKLRSRFRQLGVPAARAAVVHVPRYDQLPFTGGVFNWVVTTDIAPKGGILGDVGEFARVLSPLGRMIVGQGPSNGSTLTVTQLQAWVKKLKSVQLTKGSQGLWARFNKPRPAGAGDWSHLYGKPSNSAFGGETLQGATRSQDLRVQWIGRPGSRYQADRNGRKPSPLSVNGRLYLQGLRRLVTLDCYNGTVLWSLEIPPLGRFNMPRDCSNWCADKDHLFVAIGRHCWQINGQTGQLKQRLVAAKDSTDHWGFVARKGDLLFGSRVSSKAQFTSFWGGSGEGWYDAKSGPATFKVCSDELFAIDLKKVEQARKWTYRGIIVNSTITVGKSYVYFTECRAPDVTKGKTRRLGGKAFWGSQYLVAVDLRTGKKLWEKKLQQPPGEVVYFLAFAEGHLSLVSSSAKKYHVAVFAAKDGKRKWATSYPWKSDNHGGHMSRPAIVGNTLYVRPRAFELKTGLLLSRRMPHGSCGTYACTEHAVFYRSSTITVWDRQRGGVTRWHRLRPDCWLSTIPAGGMLLSPEGGGGCSCGSWMETSIGFAPVGAK